MRTFSKRFGYILLFMSDHFSESVFFTKQFIAKGAQLLSMVGVDQCLLPEDFPEEDMDDRQSDDSQWQAVVYELRQPIKPIPLSMQSRIVDDYQLATGRSVQFGSGISEIGEGVGRSLHWQIRREEAVVDCFSVAFSEEQGFGRVQQVTHPLKLSEHCQYLLEIIGKINTMWEGEGFEISSIFINTDNCRLVIRFNESAFLYELFWTEKDELLPKLQAAVVSYLMNNQIGHHLKAVNTASVRADLQNSSLQGKIALVYRLNQLGLTLSLSYKSILTKANPPAYHRCIFHIAQMCAIHQKYDEEAMTIVESQQDGVQTAFTRLYQCTISVQSPKESDV